MPAGIQLFDEAGNVIFDTGDRMGRVIGVITYAGGSTQLTQAISIPSGSSPFFYVTPNPGTTNFVGLPAVSMTSTQITYGPSDGCQIFWGAY